MVKCPECGEVLDESKDKRCPKCGYILTDDLGTVSQSKDKKSNNKIIAVIAVVVIISIIAVFASGMLSNNNTVDDTDSADDSVYWGSTKTDKFHLPDCEWAEKISEDNKIIYQSREDAIEDGKEPCGECNP